MRLAGGRSVGVSDRTALVALVRQARELAQAENEGWMDGAVANWMTADRSHPFAAWRLLN